MTRLARGSGVVLLALLGVSGGCSLAGAPPRRPPSGESPASTPPPGARPPAVAPGAIPRTVARRFAETRALWVIRGTLSHPDSVRAMVRRADEAGFNTLLIQIRGRGDAYYRHGWEPPADLIGALPADYDPLALALEEAHARDMAVHAWINTHLVADAGNLPTDPSHVVNARPDLLAVPKELAERLYNLDPRDPTYVRALAGYARDHPERVEGLYTSPSSPEVKERVHALWMDVASRYPVDGMHFDYIRYPGPEFDYSRGALHRFRSWVWRRLEPSRRQNLEDAFTRDPLAYVEALPEAWDEFRRQQIDDLVTRIYYGVKMRRPEVVVSAAVFANRDDAFRFRFQDWQGWLRDGVLDIVVPMAYTADDELFGRQIRDAREAAGAGDRVWAGIGAYQNTLDGTVRKIRAARELGAAGVVLFSYDWAVREDAYLRRVGEEAFGRKD